MDNQLITDIAAWVGAVVAVLVLAWDVYKEARKQYIQRQREFQQRFEK